MRAKLRVQVFGQWATVARAEVRGDVGAISGIVIPVGTSGFKASARSTLGIKFSGTK
jgi:hypothetical protein